MLLPIHRRQLLRLALVPLTLLLSNVVIAQSTPSVIGTRVVMSTWSDPLEALGTLSADESVTLSATVTDIVADINFRDGEQVEKGQLLIRLEDAEEQAQLRASQALREERLNASNRASQLQERNLAARADVEDSLSRLRQADANIQAIEAQLANYQIKAPFNGRVGFRNISIGALVTPGMELVTLDKLDVMQLDFGVPEVFLGRLSPGLMLNATTAAYPDDIFSGEVATIGTRVDPVTRSVNIRADLDNADDRLRPGMLMEVIVQQRVRDTIVIPEAAIEPSGDRHFVMLIEQPEGTTRLARREVVIGERRNGEVEILEGLAPDDLIVVHGLQLARDGQEARLIGIVDEETGIRALLEADR
ncbi:efflux RND transporter periplasmic adaptor subunit [Vreelandella boliviensis]|uniref:MexH family multidrug efflux RND transporter periplasmic adaptor subunit n=1 Tax=Vreelandella boliviensis LC1 TaxID=1072583 RepID=A0A265DTU9_9GAMM|nr:efflux RND transporter periplasmic adaptor subunit [Halomonas boliviensis]EHJ92361.1 Multidrug resistance protein mdtA [Halomonas boliviensis LC1]OZT72749.1 MexH family multidrug efflux RND transporter periplasmic adaptor subunit [Halomonas boliviensis LC1]